MRIMICGSMSFADEMLEAKETLEQISHDVLVSGFIANHVGLTHEQSERQVMKEKREDDAMRVDFQKLHHVDAVLVLNFEKRGIPNYIGGNTFLEMGLAHVLGRKIFLANPVPDIPVYRSEIEAMLPIVIGTDYSLIV